MINKPYTGFNEVSIAKGFTNIKFTSKNVLKLIFQTQTGVAIIADEFQLDNEFESEIGQNMFQYANLQKMPVVLT
ncbi:MAG TPA: hypothetical protein PLK11_04275 [Methanofastidiosum sp.]|nr:hypothetical protein [Methanofastidiosum sp.]HOE93533.1 hypothetical protein [Methanofastidiosum sp.]HOR88403.1 hypothetical protein [Methanofastidiosum sp.]HPL00546.1 hypothetical protein [Methanofastidiosum sp.]